MKSLPNHKKQLGKIGEDLASNYLQKQGFHILDRNFKARYGELDIIGIDKDTLVFVEVKTRIGRRYGTPEEAVTPRKLHEVIMTAQYYKLLHPELPDRMRVDVIAIELHEDKTVKHFRHIPNVTQ